ncbi:hypothetical protein M3664_04735 [Paenibacillus lautus]|uniref:hypothetical protein n=1 Tax=Paenibacillus lautus TaxID=1401 RepID=UPI00203D46E9|nr:hypothetical protein [Paenibacillus lautus]MCM3257088.1 hypothetical protein [Paenibacillus lautus]
MDKINGKFTYWEFFFDEDMPDSTYPTPEDRQCVGSIWSDEWSGLELFEMSDEELKAHLLEDIRTYEWSGEKVDKRKIKAAINELRKIQKEQAIEKAI